MAYGILPYRIDLTDIEDLFGVSKTIPAIKDRIMQSAPHGAGLLDRDFPVEDGWMKAEDILINFLDGVVVNYGENTTKHWYVIELLIQMFGQSLPNAQWYPAGIDPFYSIDCFRMYRIAKNRTFNLPSPDGFPAVFSVEYNLLDEALEQIKQADFDPAQIAEFESWVQLAKEDEQDLVLFYF